ncbi:MAG: histidinol-phosphate transaminase [Methylotenera sp.]|nr:histidinol-phosphate transaminase [Methylotenera sp.]MDP1754102.1 histidinol-phosphate transaminase [Methylotenera sp.]MDP1959394.1 histidinol-phosphate transaminase [Methylotenera sp.]MDP3302556.1 histidinol-phosphate transaminase [Methylotenera sp.]MDP3944235.1 histidinol-phosphate transaminase [Methylotenera sp.]
MSKYWSDIVHKLTPYVPGEQPKLDNLVKLNTNENPYGPSPKVIAALKLEAADTLRLYPDPNSDALKAAIAEAHHLNTNQVFVGNGSDEVLAHVFQALLKHSRPLLFPDITYSFYPVYCGLYNIEYQTIPLAEDFTINVDDYVQPNGGIIFPNPNAPTGIPLALVKIEKILKNNTQSVVVVDEAYVDFGTESAVSLINNYPNLLVTHTLSKARSLAGLRVGYALGSPELIEALIRVKDSFNSYPIDRFASAGAIAAMQDEAYFEKTCSQVIATREQLIKNLVTLGFEVLPSGANFIFAKHKAHDGAELSAKLREHNIIVRHFKSPNRVAPYLRITIGTDAQSETLLAALSVILG